MNDNPYCSGRKNRIILSILVQLVRVLCLNPYCSGRKNRIANTYVANVKKANAVLILIVMEERIG